MGFIKSIYDWVLSFAETKYGILVLFILSFTESAFSPLPPDLFLIVLALAIPKKSMKYAFVCTIASVMGGVMGYAIGLSYGWCWLLYFRFV